MELTARRSERSADERCPFCHDALTALPDDLVACPGCATHHHRACVEELGRCTIRGCERALAAEPEADPLAGRLRRSSVTEEVRRRLRARARTFLAAHCAPVPVRERVFRNAPGDDLRVEELWRLRAPSPFDVELARALDAARDAWIRERPAACRRVAELLRGEGRARFADAEVVAVEHERRAAELDGLLAHYDAQAAGSEVRLGAILVLGLLLGGALLQALAFARP